MCRLSVSYGGRRKSVPFVLILKKQAQPYVLMSFKNEILAISKLSRARKMLIVAEFLHFSSFARCNSKIT